MEAEASTYVSGHAPKLLWRSEDGMKEVYLVGEDSVELGCGGRHVSLPIREWIERVWPTQTLKGA